MHLAAIHGRDDICMDLLYNKLVPITIPDGDGRVIDDLSDSWKIGGDQRNIFEG